jgi:hypothetical protein
MTPTPNSNTTANAMRFLEHSSIVASTPIPGLVQAYIRPSPTACAANSATGGFAHLAPETRNEIYELAFRSPSAFFVEAAEGASPGFRLSERSDEAQHNAVRALQALGLVNRQIRREARTFFYASKRMLVLSYGYEYLPIFVHWLCRIGPECRAVLRTICFAGYMWYQPSIVLDLQFHDLLRSCTNLRRLTVQMNIWHLLESCNPDLDAHLNNTGAWGLHGDQMLQFDVSIWAETIAHLCNADTVCLDFIASFDRERDSLKAKSYVCFMKQKGRTLANDVEMRLRQRMEEMSTGREVNIVVKYVGIRERVYLGRPW